MCFLIDNEVFPYIIIFNNYYYNIFTTYKQFKTILILQIYWYTKSQRFANIIYKFLFCIF